MYLRLELVQCLVSQMSLKSLEIRQEAERIYIRIIEWRRAVVTYLFVFPFSGKFAVNRQSFDEIQQDEYHISR